MLFGTMFERLRWSDLLSSRLHPFAGAARSFAVAAKEPEER